MADGLDRLPVSQVERHGGARVRRLEMHMSYVCDQACAFCSESARMAAFAKNPISLRSMVETLVRKRRDGCDHVTFTGGEPTLHPRFLDLLSAAKRLGYRTYITTDGQRLADPAFAEWALPLLDELCISIHGPGPEVHDPLVKKTGSFKKTMAAVRQVGLARPRPYLLTNTVVVRGSLAHLEETVDLLSGLEPVRHLTISNLAPDGDALKGYDAQAVRLSELRPRVPRLADLARARGRAIRFFGVPLCILGGDGELPNDLHWTPRVTVERGWVGGRVGLQEIHSPDPGRMRFYPARCAGCRAKGKCWGIFRRYAKRFGDVELTPL